MTVGLIHEPSQPVTSCESCRLSLQVLKLALKCKRYQIKVKILSLFKTNITHELRNVLALNRRMMNIIGVEFHCNTWSLLKVDLELHLGQLRYETNKLLFDKTVRRVLREARLGAQV